MIRASKVPGRTGTFAWLVWWTAKLSGILRHYSKHDKYDLTAKLSIATYLTIMIVSVHYQTFVYSITSSSKGQAVNISAEDYSLISRLALAQRPTQLASQDQKVVDVKLCLQFALGPSSVHYLPCMPMLVTHHLSYPQFLLLFAPFQRHPFVQVIMRVLPLRLQTLMSRGWKRSGSACSMVASS